MATLHTDNSFHVVKEDTFFWMTFLWKGKLHVTYKKSGPYIKEFAFTREKP